MVYTGGIPHAVLGRDETKNKQQITHNKQPTLYSLHYSNYRIVHDTAQQNFNCSALQNLGGGGIVHSGLIIM